MLNTTVLRILDANANRAREALRVVEEYARFVLNNPSLQGDLKQLRHDLTGATAAFLGEAILHRDTPGDVGTQSQTEAEGSRPDLAAVVTAAGKRLGEALRVIEEVLKIDSGPARDVEAIRYRWYALEQQIARTLSRGGRFAAVRLYVLITEKLCRRPWLEAAQEAIEGGADCLQLREKKLEGAELLRRAQLLVELCRRRGVLAIINDRPDIAVLTGADGVHVGQEDLPAHAVRKIVGNQMIVGVSTHRLEQARQAVLDGADYIGVGPMFVSSTKARDFVAGPEYAREVDTSTFLSRPWQLAGLRLANIAEVLAAGVKCVAATASVIGCDDVRAAATQMKMRIAGPQHG